MTGLKQLISALLRMTALPVLRGLGGFVWTLMVPTLRVLSGVSIVIASVAMASDAGPVSFAGGVHLKSTPVLAHWQQVAPSSLEATRGFVQKRMRPWIWDAVSAPLKMPSFVFFLLLGVLLGYLGRHRRQVAIFANQ